MSPSDDSARCDRRRALGNPKADHECKDQLVIERPLPTILGGRGLFVSLVAGTAASLSAGLKSGKLLTTGSLTGSMTLPMIKKCHSRCLTPNHRVV